MIRHLHHIASKFLIFLSHKYLLVLFFFGFASAIPLPLLGSSLTIRLIETGFSKPGAALISSFHFFYSLKLLWSPVIDYVSIPFLTKHLGQRPSWACFSFLGTMASLTGLAWLSPQNSIVPFCILLSLASLFSSCMYMVGIAYELESIDRSLYPAGSASVIIGYRLGLFCGGAGTLYLADCFEWSVAYTLAIGAMSLGLLAVWLRGPLHESDRMLQEKKGLILGSKNTFRICKKAAYEAWISPVREFLSRKHWLFTLFFLLLYRFADHVMDSMQGPFFLELGFSKTQIADATKVWGIAFTLIGASLGGLLSTKLPLKRALSISLLIHAFSFLLFSCLADTPSLALLYFCSSIDHLTGGLVVTSFIAYLWQITTPCYGSAQYTLLWSVISFSKSIIAPFGGLLAQSLGWQAFFLALFAAASASSVISFFALTDFKKNPAPSFQLP